MRRTATLLVLTLAGVAAVVGLAGPASAGGPTSVLITVPGEGRSTALYYTDTAYERLSDALGMGREVRPVGDPPNDFRDAPPVILTWLIHDVMVWRVDQVYVHGDTTYVLTQENVGGGPLSEGTSVLHKAGPGLMQMLDQVLPDGNGYLEDTPLDPQPAPDPAARPSAAPSAGSSAAPPVLLAGAGLGGLLVGVLGTVTAFAVRRPREAATPATAAPGDFHTQPERAPHDELVWP